MSILDDIPETIPEHLAYRKYIREWVDTSRKVKIITEKCREDGADGFLFFLRSFAWLHEPRPRVENGKRLPTTIPFIPWPHQTRAVHQIFGTPSDPVFGFHDIGCLAGDTVVVTDRGPVMIKDVRLSDKVWDGIEFVSHGGIVNRGRKRIISAYGLRLTPDHLVLTVKGWHRADKSYDRAKVRMPDSSVDLRSSGEKPSYEGGSFEEVYDLVDCGPRNRFVVLGDEPTITHNCEKSRGEGMSWLVLMLFLHQFLYVPQTTYGVVSRTMDAVDKSNDMSALLPKIDWELKMLPKWMVGYPGVDYKRNHTDHTFINLRNGSSIVGHATGGDLASGGRTTAFLMDEMAKFPKREAEDAMSSTEPVSDCRILVSTPKGNTGAYARAMSEKSSIVKIRLHWADNPLRNRGLYRVVGGLPMALDPNNPLPIDYVERWKSSIRDELLERGFSFTKSERSPWYDQRCLRPRMNPTKVAQEYDIDYVGSVSKVFSEVLLERLRIETVKPEVIRGELIFNVEDFFPKFVENQDGRLRLWVPLEGKSLVPPREIPYVVGNDICSGQAGPMTSNSVASIVQRTTGIKVGEFASNSMPPQDFANYAIALCKFFKHQTGNEEVDAYMIWEDNGYGSSFRNQVIKMGFRHFYLRTVRDSIGQQKTKKPGFHTGVESKVSLIGEYQYALQQGMFTNPCKESIDECGMYNRTPDGSIEFEGNMSDDTATGSKKVHGDRVIADAVAWHACQEFTIRKGKGAPSVPNAPPPATSFAARREKYLADLERTTLW